MNIFKKIIHLFLNIKHKSKYNNILICPMCGSIGYIYHKKYAGYGAKCPNCSFSVQPVYKYVDGPIIMWEKSCKSIKDISNNKQKEIINQINKNIITWQLQFPEIEGDYIIRLTDGGLILRHIGNINNNWCDAYGPIDRYIYQVHYFMVLYQIQIII